MSLRSSLSFVRSIAFASAVMMLTGCGSFAVKYQNYFTKNFAYFASNYDGNPGLELASGAESNNFEDGNLESYSAGKFPTVITGFRTLEYQNSDYSRAGSFDIEFGCWMVPPGKSEAEAVSVATFSLKGKNLSYVKQLAEAKNVVMIKMSYPAPMVYLDNAALQKTYGSGVYTMIWKATKEDGKDSSRELSRVTTNLTP
ncbi:MAG: hypothetical protein V4760_08345 [Bdellovibrionota bacterium]